jgi:hypothetical protein
VVPFDIPLIFRVVLGVHFLYVGYLLPSRLTVDARYCSKPHTCQCTKCRKSTGALMCHYINIRPHQITWYGSESDVPSTLAYWHDPLNSKSYLTFCRTCGSVLAHCSSPPIAIARTPMDPVPALPRQRMEILTGTLDDEVLKGKYARLLTFPALGQFGWEKRIQGVTDGIETEAS